MMACPYLYQQSKEEAAAAKKAAEKEAAKAQRLAAIKQEMQTLLPKLTGVVKNPFFRIEPATQVTTNPFYGFSEDEKQISHDLSTHASSYQSYADPYKSLFAKFFAALSQKATSSILRPNSTPYSLVERLALAIHVCDLKEEEQVEGSALFVDQDDFRRAVKKLKIPEFTADDAAWHSLSSKLEGILAYPHLKLPGNQEVMSRPRFK
jgi:hypothetical protein